MEIIKFDRVVSVSSELQGHGVQNILEGEISPNKNWLCEKGTERAVAILQLEGPTLVASVHVGNAHSAFVEVLVGRAADGSDQFQSLVPMSVLMNPHESKTGTNPNRTRFFNRSDFNESAAGKSWDRVKVVCTQPFNKHVPYGLCFLKVHGEREARMAEGPVAKTEDSDEIQVGSFFKKKRSSGGDRQLSASQQMKEAEKELTRQVVAGPSSEKKPEDKKREKNSESNKKGKREEKTPKRKTEEKGEGEGRLKRRAEQKPEKREEGTPKRKKKEKPEKREEEGTPKGRREEKHEKRKRKKVFEKLMEDVVLVISGFKNPLRGEIRTMALEMGAKYSADWEPHCTHLVCAYDNTPKFHQVKGKGKIVKKEWVERCHADRKRYPWRRFALDKADLNKPESEEEVEAGEEEDLQVASTSKQSPGGGSSLKKESSGNDDYDAATDDEEEKNVDTTDYPMPHLPDVFSLQTFYVDPNLRERAALERYIVAYDGVLAETFNEDVNFYVTDRGGAPVELFRKRAPNLVAVKPSWIWEINSKQKRISSAPHLVN